MQGIAPINWLRLVLLAIIWGASFLGVSLSLQGVGPFTVAAVRLGLGALILVSVAFSLGRGLPPLRGPGAGRVWLFIVAMALFSNAIPFSLLSWGQQSVASGFAGVCMAVVPLFVLPLAHVMVPGEQMRLRRLIGFTIGTVGVIVLIGPEAFASTGKDLESLAKIACVMAAGCYAIGAICTRLCPEVDRLSMAAAVLLLASLVQIPLALSVEGVPRDVGLVPLLALLYLGVLPTAAAQFLLTMVIREAGPVFMSLVNYQVPLWSVFLGAIILSEPLPPSLLLAMVLILGGVMLSQLGALRRLFFKKR